MKQQYEEICEDWCIKKKVSDQGANIKCALKYNLEADDLVNITQGLIRRQRYLDLIDEKKKRDAAEQKNSL